VENFESDLYQNGPPYLTPAILEGVGKALMVSILDILAKNPLSRLPFTNYENIEQLREDLAERIRNLHRFSKLEDISTQVENINQDIEQKYYKSIKKKLFKKSSKITKMLG